MLHKANHKVKNITLLCDKVNVMNYKFILNIFTTQQ